MALVGATERLDRATLIDRINRITHAICGAVPTGAAVATLVPHSPAGIAAILGVLAAGLSRP
jgi:hypothetical protein